MSCLIPSLRLSLIGLVVCAFPAFAHFQQIIPSADVLPEGGPVTLDFVFTHPVEGGPVMVMKKPAKVGVLVSGQRTDLLGQLAEKPVDGQMAWTLTYDLPQPGAAVFFVEPQPYWEAAENKYIVQYSKVIVDSFASGEGWDELVGLPVEIQLLTRPTGIWTGNLFSAVVLKNGKPVPFAKVEVEFINDGSVKPPNDAFVTQVIKADANGTFTYALPRAGWWGFAALLEGDTPKPAPDGRDAPVEEGALIWVKATDIGGKQASMAHIPDGILSLPVLIGGGAIAAGGVAVALKRLDDRMIPRAAILCAVVFAASLVAVPVGPSSVHLLLSGLMGLMLGAATFAAVLVILLLQLLLFGFGGLTTLGVNTVNIALPGVVFALLLGPYIRKATSGVVRTVLSAAVGGLSVLGTGGLVALSLALSSSDYTPVASVLIATYLPLALVEGFVTAGIVAFLARVQPDSLRRVVP